MKKNVLLLGRLPFNMDEWRANVTVEGVTLFSGTTIEHVRDAFAQEKIDIVIMGAGLDLATRLEIVETVFNLSSTTTVHMKDRDSGRDGMLPFVNGILQGLVG